MSNVTKTLIATRADIGQIASALNRHGAREGEQCQNPLGVERPMAFATCPRCPSFSQNPTGCATCMTFCMDYEPHDRLLHATSSHNK